MVYFFNHCTIGIAPGPHVTILKWDRGCCVAYEVSISHMQHCVMYPNSVYQVKDAEEISG